MDEAEKYKQRLEAIAEKRRLLEEQERAKREMEDERIRLQQLKRKSLRDQWLMDGPPVSPTSSDPPRSPLWGTQAQEIEKRIDKLESKTQQLAEAEEKLKEVMEDGQIETVVEETPTEMSQDVVHNGKNAAESGEEIVTECPQLDKILTNGEGGLEEDISVDMLPTSNGLTEETKSKQVVNTDNNVDDDDDDEDGTMVIRAECIMIVDESDETPEESKENESPVINATLIPEETEKTVTESAQSEGTVTTSVEAELLESAVIPNGVEEDELKEARAAQLQSQTEEGGDVVLVEAASVPVYAETQPCITTTSQVEVENEEDTIEVSSKATGNVTVEFQEVPLSEAQDKKAPSEQEPLLSRIKAKSAEPVIPSNQTETPDRADQAETKTPKRKTCQCCSVM